MPMEPIPLDEVGTHYPDLLREQVMVVSNEDEPVLIGHITGFYPMGDGPQLIPQVTLLSGEVKVSFSALLPYDPDLFQLLNSMGHKRRYVLITKLYNLQSEIKRLFFRPRGVRN